MNINYAKLAEFCEAYKVNYNVLCMYVREAVSLQPPSAPVAVDGCTESNCPRCLTHPDHRGDMAHAGIGSYPAQQSATITVRDAEHGTVEVTKVFPGDVIAAPYDTAPPSTPVEVEGLVATIPDNCDRFVWRGRYHHLPRPAAVDEVESLPDFLDRIADELVSRDTRAGTFAPGIARSLQGRASILRTLAKPGGAE